MRKKRNFWIMGIMIGMLLLSSALPILAEEAKKRFKYSAAKSYCQSQDTGTRGKKY